MNCIAPTDGSDGDFYKIELSVEYEEVRLKMQGFNAEMLQINKEIDEMEKLGFSKDFPDLSEMEILRNIEKFHDIEKRLMAVTSKRKECNKRSEELYCRGPNRWADFNPWEVMESINVTEEIETFMKGNPVPRKDLIYNSKYIIKSTKETKPIILIGTYKENNGFGDSYQNVVSFKIDGYKRPVRLAESYVVRDVTFYDF